MKLHELEVRGCDSQGCGHFGASRGSREHKGIDLLALQHQGIQATVSGKVTKLGYPYADDLSYRYVEITNDDYKFRIFYIKPTVVEGQEVSSDDTIGIVQDLERRYEGISNHVHFEIMKGDEYIDPTPVIIALKSV